MKIIFSSAHCLVDPSSGAARSVATFLGFLAKAGHECLSLTGSVYDRPLMDNPVENIAANGGVQAATEKGPVDLWRQDLGGVRHIIVPTLISNRTFLPARDELKIFKHAKVFLREKKPDAVLTFGNGLLELCIVREAQDLGIATFFYLAHPGYKHKDTFKFIDQVFTDTEATRDLYRERMDLDAYAIGKFIVKPRVPSVRPSVQYVTFVNPSPEKGVMPFYRIAEAAEKRLPNVKFLVVESRATLAQIDEKYKTEFSRLGNITKVGLQQDMGGVFAMTRILLMPSLWHESGGRVAIEAQSLGIPVIATASGGLPENLGEAATYVEVSHDMGEKYENLPPESAAEPWIAAIEKLMSDGDHYNRKSAASLEQWKKHDPELRIPAISKLMEEVIARKRGRSAPTREGVEEALPDGT